MICEKCKGNQATVHITKIINGNKQELNVCEECAKEVEGLGVTGKASFITPFSFQNILSGLMEYMNQNTQEVKSVEVSCATCGTTYSQFKQSGLLGCSECYANFENTLIPVIKRVQGNNEHVGKIPKKSGKEIMEKKKLITLKEELQKAIAVEEYEKAAKIRDEIRNFKQDK